VVADPRREWVAGALAARRPVDAREAAAVRRFRDELARLPHPFDEAGGPVHVTGSAVVVGSRGVLLHRHKRLGLWLQPGGHVEPGEWPDETAGREAAEETGVVGRRARHAGDVPLPLAHVDVHGGGRGHVHLDLRYVIEADGDPAPAAGESPDVAWFAWDDALAVADPGLAGLLRALAPASPRRGGA
jgi:8-oxo-dGTP pyrophosphatase MutT (NUDIX family)